MEYLVARSVRICCNLHAPISCPPQGLLLKGPSSNLGHLGHHTTGFVGGEAC